MFATSCLVVLSEIADGKGYILLFNQCHFEVNTSYSNAHTKLVRGDGTLLFTEDLPNAGHCALYALTLFNFITVI